MAVPVRVRPRVPRVRLSASGALKIAGAELIRRFVQDHDLHGAHRRSMCRCPHHRAACHRRHNRAGCYCRSSRKTHCVGRQFVAVIAHQLADQRQIISGRGCQKGCIHVFRTQIEDRSARRHDFRVAPTTPQPPYRPRDAASTSNPPAIAQFLIKIDICHPSPGMK